jgi:hypothetical protein
VLSEYGCKQAYAAEKGDRQPEHDSIDARALARELVPPIFDPFAFDQISYSALLAGLGNLCRLSGLGGRILDATPGGFDFGFAGAVIAGP